MSNWRLAAEYRALRGRFWQPEKVFALQGERITYDPLSELIRVQRDGVAYYVKRYRNAGKGLRRYAARPRIKAGGKTQTFCQMGIPTAG